MTGAR